MAQVLALAGAGRANTFPHSPSLTVQIYDCPRHKLVLFMLFDHPAIPPTPEGTRGRRGEAIISSSSALLSTHF